MRNLVWRICCGLAVVSAIFAAISPAQTSPAKSDQPNAPAVSVDNSTSSTNDSKANKAKVKAGNTKPNSAKANNPKSGAPKSGAPKSGTAKVLPGITPEREAAVMTFVKRHHPELTELLIHLKENTPKEYDRAVRDLFRTSERLAQVQERDSLAYDLELQLWQARSRAQLLAARLQMADSEDLRKQLRSALSDEYDLRLKLLQREREKVSERMKHLSDQVEKLNQRRDEEIDKQMKQLTAAARGSEVKVKNQSKKKAENK